MEKTTITPQNNDSVALGARMTQAELIERTIFLKRQAIQILLSEKLRELRELRALLRQQNERN